jgi:hypothetical protein
MAKAMTTPTPSPCKSGVKRSNVGIGLHSQSQTAAAPRTAAVMPRMVVIEIDLTSSVPAGR